MRFQLVALALTLSVVSSSHAKVIYDDGDWELDDLSPKDPQGTCLAYTTTEVGRTLYRLEFSRQKNSQNPLEVYIRQQGKGPQRFTAQLNDGSSMSFAFSTVSGKSNLLWYIPQRTQSLFDHLEARKDLKLKPADGSKDIKLSFSADGFKRVRDKFIEKCNDKQPILDIYFEDTFLTHKDSIDPSKVSADRVQELRRLFYTASGVYRSMRGNRGEFENLRRQFSVQLNEQAALNSLIDRLGNRDIPSTIQDISSNDSLEKQKTSELAQTKLLISQQQKLIESAKGVFSNAQATIAPYQGEHDQREDRAESSRQRSNQDLATLNSIDQGIFQARTNINSLVSEANRLQDENSRTDVDLRRARIERMRADGDYRDFDSRQEVGRRLQLNPTYGNLRINMPNLEREARVYGVALTDAQGMLVARQTELKVCQTSISFYSGPSYRLPAQEDPTRPGRNGGGRPGGDNGGGRPGGDNGGGRPGGDNGGGRPGGNNGGDRPGQGPTPTPTPSPATPNPQPVPSTPTPAPAPTPAPVPSTDTTKCSSQVDAVTKAQAVVDSLKLKSQDANQKLSTAREQMRNIEEATKEDVKRISEELGRRSMKAGRRVDELETRLINIESRLNVISTIELPREQNRLDSLQNQRGDAQAQSNQSSALANKYENELANFEVRVGWQQKVKAVEDAKLVLRDRNDDLNDSLSLKQSTENIISNCQSERVRLNDVLASRQQQKAQSEARLVEVNKSLEPYNQQKDVLDGKLSDLKNQLSGLSVQFENQIMN